MQAIFTFYWKFLGLPLSEFKGAMVDQVSFNVTELLVWTSLICSIIWIKNFKKIYLRFNTGIWGSSLCKWGLCVFGPLLLFLLASGQGALPFSPAPTAMRPTLYSELNPPEVTQQEFFDFTDTMQNLLLKEFDKEHYRRLTENEMIDDCNSMLDDILLRLDFTSGRTVRGIKKMRGLSRVFGLSYGGPAYHDPLTSELALAAREDYPTPKAWRIHAACHEIAHAKGYGREMDAEILTQLSLLFSDNSLYRAMGCLMYLKKTGQEYESPVYLTEEQVRVNEEFKKIRKKQYVIRALSWMNRKLSLRNRSEKYGNIKPHQPFNAKHPYFATVIHLSQNPL